MDTVQRLGAKLGASFKDGGRHPSFGTCNFVLPLSNGMYLEVVSPLDHPAADRSAYGQAVRRRAEAGGGWLGWVVSVNDITNVETRLGRESVAGHRRRPDGYDLQWKQIGVNDLIADPQLPFFIEWISPAEQHPSAGSSEVRLAGMQICGEADAISDYLGEPKAHPLDAVEVEFVDGDEPGLLTVTFETANGTVVID